MESFRKADSEKIKQILSCRIDTYRKHYGREAQDHPRTSVFVGTTNEHAYLKDNSGGRRFWPLRCKAVNLEYIRQNREQLFAEAVAMFKKNEKWWEMPKEETEVEQESRRIADEWEYAVEEFVAARTEVTVREIAKDCLGIEIAKLDKMVQMRITKILRRLKLEKAFKSNSKYQGSVWYKAEQEKLALTT